MCVRNRQTRRSGCRCLWAKSDEEIKRQIDHMLLATSRRRPWRRSLRRQQAHDGFKRGQDFVDLNSVAMNGTEGLRAPEHVVTGRTGIDAAGQSAASVSFSLFLISASSALWSAAWSFFGNPIGGLCARDGVAKPSHRGLVR